MTPSMIPTLCIVHNMTVLGSHDKAQYDYAINDTYILHCS